MIHRAFRPGRVKKIFLKFYLSSIPLNENRTYKKILINLFRRYSKNQRRFFNPFEYLNLLQSTAMKGGETKAKNIILCT